MRIALLGGTGDIGEGLALRWAFGSDHEVVIGSRDPDRARAAAAAYEDALAGRGVDRTINGFVNAMAADRADVIVLSVPPEHVAGTIGTVADRVDDAILVSPAVALERDGSGVHYTPPPSGSVTAEAAAAAPDGVPVVGAFHGLPAGRLADLDAELGLDVPVVGDDRDAKGTVARLAEAIDGLDAVDAGGIANAPEVEGLAALLINVAIHDEDRSDVGVRFA